jgi:predicted transglutaminase-like cysteine proteinase
MRLGVGIFFIVGILNVSAMHPAMPHPGDIISFDSSHLKTAAFTGGTPQARQDASKESDRPTATLFGMDTVPIEGDLAGKWAAVEAEIDREQQVLARCRAQEACPVVALDMLNIVAAGAGRSGLARVGLINRAVNLAIKPTSDEAQWGISDHWSPPFETLQTHRGDCEDYAIAKYVALLQAGVSRDDVKIAIIRKRLPAEDHAVVVSRVDGRWLILDNLRLALVRDTELIGFTPNFVLDEIGARRFVQSSRLRNGRDVPPPN